MSSQGSEISVDDNAVDENIMNFQRAENSIRPSSWFPLPIIHVLSVVTVVYNLPFIYPIRTDMHVWWRQTTGVLYLWPPLPTYQVSSLQPIQNSGHLSLSLTNQNKYAKWANNYAYSVTTNHVFNTCAHHPFIYTSRQRINENLGGLPSTASSPQK